MDLNSKKGYPKSYTQGRRGGIEALPSWKMERDAQHLRLHLCKYIPQAERAKESLNVETDNEFKQIRKQRGSKE